ncbi:Snf3p [Sugiyamaella lignohabitans]|uniref:Snf3p n=1 Tax=Sugiyamaella lignohabitans TaxID=796027 RepID=A0A167ER19_9ASCO|nr:Snf3p [Sugiyamaella lignohabitans]ANB14371.1 Snf3p [Sugiyamaella lignohabitans]
MAFIRITNPYVVALIATIGGMLFGFDISSVSAFVSQDEYRKAFGFPNSITQGGITAAMSGGSFIGSIISGVLSDKYGRRPTITLSSVIWMVGAAIQCSSGGHSPSGNKAQLIVGRVVAGFAIGLASSQVPVYVAELAPKNIRGRLVGLFQWAVTWGIMIMFYIGYGCSFISGKASFRTAWGIQIVPGFLLFIGTLCLPESPRWLASKDRWEEAIEIIAATQAHGDVNDSDVLIEVEEIKEVIRIDRESQATTILDLFKKDSLNRTMVGIWAQIWQQMTGVNVAMYYVVNIFEMAGYTGNVNLVSSSIQYVLNMVMTVPALLFIDSWGRRPLLLIGGVLMMTWLFAISGLLAVYSNPVDSVDGNTNIRILIPKDRSAASKAVIACSYLFVSSFAPTWGPGIWIYCSEIFPLRQRALANGICASFNWIFNFALALFVPSAFTNITWKTYIIFGVFCVAMIIHVFFLFPETKGKSLEEIDQIWAENIPAWRTANWQPRLPSVSDIKAVNGGRAPTFADKVEGEQEHKEALPETAV